MSIAIEEGNHDGAKDDCSCMRGCGNDFQLAGTRPDNSERIRARRQAMAQRVNHGFPTKGDLALARPVELRFDGVMRSYLIEVSKGPGPLSVVVLLHGGTEDAERVWQQTSLPTLARSEGFIVVAPNALNKHWNDGRGMTLSGAASKADDVGFLKRVIADVIAKDGGNPKTVFMAGVSNGGIYDHGVRLPGRQPAARGLLHRQHLAQSRRSKLQRPANAVACDERDRRPDHPV